MLPDLHERLPVCTVGRFESGEVGFAFRLGLGGKHDAGQVKAAEKFEQEKANGAAVEILEGVNGEKAPFGEGEKLQHENSGGVGSRSPADLKVSTVVAHLERDKVRGWRDETPHADFDGAPASRPVWHEIVADQAMKLLEEDFVERGSGEGCFVDSLLNAQHTLSQKRRYLAVGKDSASGFNPAGGVVRACSSWRVLRGTGSRSKAMLWATSTGIASQRRRSFSVGERSRHWLMAWVQFMGHRINGRA